MGNRLSQETIEETNTYTYDAANRMTSVDGVTYTWDANGNMLSDGVSTYTYDHANRLTGVTGTDVSSFVYNGLGDRYQQIVNSATTTYQLDLAAGLVNVLADGENTYLYGNTVLAQVSDTQTGYYLPDVLGSVRQMTSSTGEVKLSQRFTPFGEVKEKYGDGEASFGYTAQKYDAQTGLLYLRARYYSAGSGRFISHDPWSGDMNMPMSYNAWLYGYGNPIRYLDPSGMEAYLYNRNEAVAYANAFAKIYNFIQYGVFLGSDCTNFVSQSLKAGGLQEDENWFYSRPGLPTTCSKYPFSQICGNTWAVAPLLYDYLTNEKLFSHTDVLGNGFEGGVIPKSPKTIPNNLLAKVREGDVVFYQQDEHGTVFNHAAFVVGWGSVTNAEQNKIFTELPDTAPLVAEHSGAFHFFSPRTINDTKSPIYKITIVHIPDIIYSPADIWDYVWRCS